MIGAFILALLLSDEVIDGKRFTFATLDPKTDDTRLFWKSPRGVPYRNFAAIENELGNKLEFAMNAGIYTRTLAPEGLHIEDGRQLVPLNTRRCRRCGNFYVQPNGVFSITKSGKASIVETDAFKNRNIRLAVQSGPLLAKNGKILPSFPATSQLTTTRNGAGVTKDGRVIFAITRDAVNMHDFAAALIKRGARDVLYFDGTISGAKTPDATWGTSNYVGMIGVVKR
jgi:uncharacterized protein YigE (DUF2233 family)